MKKYAHFHTRLAMCLLSIIVSISSLFAQRRDKENLSGSLVGTSRITNDSVQLRWSPTNARLWQAANKYGYFVSRAVVQREGKRTPWRMERLTKIPLKPLPVADWEKLANFNKKAAIPAQAIYGESFQPTSVSSSLIGKGIQASEERELRFGFTALVADQYYALAKAAALAFTDKNIKKGEAYLYKVYAAIPSKANIAADTAYILADPNLQSEVSSPGGVGGIFGNRTISLQWNSDNTPDHFSGYFIERSEDGKSYEVINSEPLVDFDNDDSPKKFSGNKVSFNDSIPANDRPYYFRVRGLTAFGELSPPSEPIKGMGFEPLAESPVLTLAGFQKDGNAQINWTFSEKNLTQIKHFQVRRSTAMKSEFIGLDSTLITLPPTINRHIDTRPQPVAFYQVIAVGMHDEQLYSQSTMIEQPDSIPPAMPTGLSGRIDTMGVVNLSWTGNTEVDLAGYRIFRAELKDDIFIQMNDHANKTTAFRDSINVHTLTKYVYYKVLAVDRRDNPSVFSATIRLQRPDKYPPSEPSFTDFEIKYDKIQLSWVNSPSLDLDSTFLYRREAVGSRPWHRLAALGKNDRTFFTDTTGTGTTHYEYHLVAKDESGKQSLDQKKYLPLTWMADTTPKAPKVSLERQKGNILVKWASVRSAKEIIIYRQKEKFPMSIYKSVPGERLQYEDVQVEPGVNYSYQVKVVFSDFTESKFSPPQTIFYE